MLHVVCVPVYLSVCMLVHIACKYSMYVCMYVCMCDAYVCIYVCMYVCMYVRMYVCVCTYL